MSQLHPLQPFYDGLVSVQQHFYADQYLQRLTHKARGFKSAITRDDFITLSLSFKSYFATQYLLSKTGSTFARHTPFYKSFTSKLQSPHFSNLPHSYETANGGQCKPLELDFAALLSYLSKAHPNDSELDWISHSLIPTVFRFYLTESNYRNLWQLFTAAVPLPVQDAIASVFFLTPAFLSFVQQTMSAPFQKLLSARGQASAALFLREVGENWRSNQSLCPFLVTSYLSLVPEDCESRIKRLFFLPFFRDPARYLGCHYSDDCRSLLENADDLLAGSEFGKLLANIATPKHLITETEELVSPIIFRAHIIDELDLDGLEHVWFIRNERARDFKLSVPQQARYRVFLVHFSGDGVPISQEEVESQTQIGERASPLMKVGFHIRAALKLAPPLQPDLEVDPNVTTVIELFERYLTDRVALPASEPLEHVRQLLAIAALPTGPALRAFFDRLKLRRTSGSRLHPLTIQLCRSVAHIRHISGPALFEIPQLLAYRRATAFARPRRLPESADVLGALEDAFGLERTSGISRAERFRKLLASRAFREDGGEIPIPAPVRFHFLAQGFDFTSFRSTHRHLELVDAQLSDILRRWRTVNAECVSPPGRWLAAHLRVLDGAAAQLIRACEDNCDPLWKAWAVHRAFAQIFWTVSVHFGKVEVSEDVHTEILKLAFSYVDPPHAASVFAFITRFLGPTPRDWADHESRAIGSVCILLQRLMVDWFPNRPGSIGVWALSRQLQRRCSLAFRQTAEKSAVSANAFFALLTGLAEDSITGMSGIPRSGDQFAPVLTVVPDGAGKLGATVLSLCEIPSGKTVLEVCDEDGKRNLAVAVWSSTLNDVTGFFGRELASIKSFFQEIDRARDESPLSDVLPRVRIILYNDTNPDDTKKLTVVQDAIRKAEHDPKEPLCGAKLVPWNANEVIAALHEGLTSSEFLN